jgi:lambda family phage portal protein
MAGSRDFSDLLSLGADDTVATGDAALPPVGSAVPSGGDVMLVGGAHEAASKFDQLALWAPPMMSADAEILPEKAVLDARTRDILRNDGYVAGGATLHKDNIVGGQFLLNAQPATKHLFGADDEVWTREFQEEAETKFGFYAEGPSCWADAKRTKTLTEIVRLALGVFTAGGEVLGSAEWMPDDGRPYRTAFQMVDADRLSTPWNKHLDYSIKGGVETDRRGAPVAYHIRNGHPSDYTNPNAYTWRRVMARKPGWGRQMILHLFEEMRAEQTRGISSMVSALMEMKMTKGFRKVELQRAVVAATYAASIESDLPSSDVLTTMGGDSGGDSATQAWMKDYLGAVDEYSGGTKNLAIDGQKIPVFMPGTRLKLQSPSNGGPMGDKFEQSLLRYISASLGVSYEQLSRDYTSTNYSSARAAMSETWKFMQSRKKQVADKTASFIYRLWLEEAINAGTLESLKRRNVPNFYEGQNADAYSACEWIGAGRGMIDPLKETQAYKLQVDSGFTTRERVMGQIHGADWRKEFEQIKREQDEMQRLDLDFSGNSQMENALTATAGARQPKEGTAEGE